MHGTMNIKYNIILRVRYACWINKATHTQTEYLVLIGIPRERLLRERACMLRYTYTACLFMSLVRIYNCDNSFGLL
jgi:hypothetical protein